MRRDHTLQVIKLKEPSDSHPKVYTEPVNIFKDNDNLPFK